MLDDEELAEVLLVDDGSTDDTAERARRYPGVRVLQGTGRGPGAARNLGWRNAKTPFVWFVDADCVAEPDALRALLEHMEDPQVAAVSGTYGNMRPDSLLATLIHEEIALRHSRMPTEVGFLATFNVLYRRSALAAVDGFDERFLKGQDAELSFRVRKDGGRLHFEPRSVVKHFHEDALSPYLRVQRAQGYWRMWLYAVHPEKMPGDSYSDLTDHLQPPLAMLSLALLPLGPLALPAIGALAALPLPMATRIVLRTGDPKHLLYAPMSAVRAYARGIGMAQGTLAVAKDRLRQLRGKRD
jgi:glycosyltransferase involved in cell wall biosynthesis